MSRLADLVFGTDVRMRPRAKLTLLTDALFSVWLVAGLLLSCTGHLSWAVMQMLAAAIVLPRLCFYPLVRSGATLQWADAGLTQLQMIHANAVAVVAYVVMPDVRAALMQVMCIVQVFGLFTLRPRAALTMGLIGAGMLLAVLAWALIAPPPHFDVRIELIRLPLSAFILSMLALLSRRYALIRATVRARKDELAAAVLQVSELVTRDPLTGLHSRQFMQDVLARERTRVARGGAMYCVGLIDLDHFKHVNDTHGHAVGDEVLVSFARVARQVLRTTDIIARWGGEEFLVLMPDTDPGTHGVQAIERLRLRLAEAAVSAAVPDLRMTFSAGVAACVSDEPAEHVIDRADRALYMAKHAGRNRSHLFPLQAPWPAKGGAASADHGFPERGVDRLRIESGFNA